MQEQTTPDRNVALIWRFYQCYASGDLETMRNQVLAPDVRWTIPGHHPMSPWCVRVVQDQREGAAPCWRRRP